MKTVIGWWGAGLVVAAGSAGIHACDSSETATGGSAAAGAVGGTGGSAGAGGTGGAMPGCGDGTVSGDEQCEPSQGPCCNSTTCTYEPADTACTDDGDDCTHDRCDGASAVCAHPATGDCPHSVVPGLHGFGTDTRGMYANDVDPEICVVTDLSNTSGDPATGTRSGLDVRTGSFRQCMEWEIDNKLIIFEVSGTIVARRMMRYRNAGLTIAAQTAPSPGVTLRGTKLVLQASDIVVQHLRIRVGDDTDGVPCFTRDGLNVTGDADGPHLPYNVVIDHCSISWGIDENSGIGGGADNITFANSIIAEGLNCACHTEGCHSKGMLISGGTTRTSILRNLFAHNEGRNPVLYGAGLFVANNYIYNLGQMPMYMVGTGIAADWNLVGNVTTPGLDTPSSHASNETPEFFGAAPEPGSTIYLVNNCIDGTCPTLDDPTDWGLVYKNPVDLAVEQYRVTTPSLWPTGYVALGTSDLQAHVATHAGARPTDRDAVDTRIVGDVLDGTGTHIDSQDDVGGWPTLAENTRAVDTGMAADGLPALPSNPHDDDDGNGYTNLEEWLHTLAAAVE